MTKQDTIERWARRVLGDAVLENRPERGLRVAEEAIELAQAMGVDRESMRRLVDYVYARPVGEPSQEVGGVMVTLYAAAASCGVDADTEFEREIARIHEPEIEKKIQRRQAEKREAMVAEPQHAMSDPNVVVERVVIENASTTMRMAGKRIDELLEVNTRLVEDRRGVDLHAMVTQFHHTGNYPVRHSPQIPDGTEVRFRLRLIAEEFFEMLEACFVGALQRQLIDSAKDLVRQVIDIGPLVVTLDELVDAWADLKYVIVGSEVSFGVDGNAVFRVVHFANLAKFGEGAYGDALGKARKPPGWKPPDIAGELERQRREEATHA